MVMSRVRLLAVSVSLALALSATVRAQCFPMGGGCPGTFVPPACTGGGANQPSSSLGFTINMSTFVAVPCVSPQVILFGGCLNVPLIIDPLGCLQNCGLFVAPAWGTLAASSFTVNIPPGLPVGMQFCVQGGCIGGFGGVPSCVNLTQGMTIVVTP